MAGLCWMAVMLAFVLSVGNSVDAVTPEILARFVDRILGKYGTDGMFSLAVMIPQNQNQNQDQNFQQVFKTDLGNKVRNMMNKNQVYIGNRVVAAKFLKGADHAELRVLANMQGLLDHHNAEDNFLLFYVYASPCPQCPLNRNWGKLNRRVGGHAFVFTKLFIPRDSTNFSNTYRDTALTQLGNAVNRHTIFRCEGGRNNVRCTSCVDRNNIAQYCYVQPPVSSHNQPSTSG
ncbi:uncharacterized protein LOC119919325 [Micropterus salmoides]|uniref:uncharacterized protein LOC119919325 n=1 Tax=Micropterus salmoides TaxID=27706 RepID=UPI0018EA50D6|nr:uncharacterized protein LOC119919325 [Micropterus salmoides]